MGREIYLYKVNEQKAQEHLIEELEKNSDDTIPFYDYSIKNDAINYNQIIDLIKTDINSIQPDELWEIIAWFNQVIVELNVDSTLNDAEKEAIATTKLLECGIELMYEIVGNKTHANIFIMALGEFEFEYNLEFFCGGGSNIFIEDFNLFLDYMIFLMGLLSLEKEWNSEEYKSEIRKTIEKYYKIEKLHKIVIKGFNFIMNRKEMDDNEGLTYASISTESKTYEHSERLFNECKALKNQLHDYHGNIIILDSV